MNKLQTLDKTTNQVLKNRGNKMFNKIVKNKLTLLFVIKSIIEIILFIMLVLKILYFYDVSFVDIELQAKLSKEVGGVTIVPTMIFRLSFSDLIAKTAIYYVPLIILTIMSIVIAKENSEEKRFLKLAKIEITLLVISIVVLVLGYNIEQFPF